MRVCMYLCIYVCVDPSARRLNHTEFEKTKKFDKTTARKGAAREASAERPGGVRGAPGSCPKGVALVFRRRSWGHQVRALKKVAIPRRAV